MGRVLRGFITEWLRTDAALGGRRRRISLTVLAIGVAFLLLYGAPGLFAGSRTAVALVTIALVVWYGGFGAGVLATTCFTIDLLCVVGRETWLVQAERVVLFLALAGVHTSIVAQAHRLSQQQRQALALRDTFLSVAAHELKTPVTSLIGFAQLARRQIDAGKLDPERVRRSVTVIELQSRRLADLVVQLLEVSRVQRGKFVLNLEVVDIQMLLRAQASQFEARDTGHVLYCDAPRTVLARLDPLRFDQVVTNLLDNAAKYSPTGALIEIGATEFMDRVYVTVRDHGYGIPPAQRSHIFEQFYQVRNERDGGVGMGLGLFICKEIIEHHGGYIEAQFPPDGGTRMVICLPKGVASADEQFYQTVRSTDSSAIREPDRFSYVH